MVDEKRLQQSIDRSEIADLVSRSILTRDTGLWDEHIETFHSRASFSSSWWQGTAADFIEVASEKLDELHREGGAQKHISGNLWIELKGTRATAECDLILFNRRVINSVELDFATWSRRLHLLCKEDGQWKIWKWFSIYERDRLDPVDPRVGPDAYYDSGALSKYPWQIRHHLWRNEIKGSAPSKNLCIRGSAEEEQVRRQARAWLAERDAGQP